MKKIQIIFIAVFFGFCSVLGILTIDNNVYKSETENRNLTVFPKMQWEGIKSVEYLTQITDAFSDQLEYRSFFVQSYFKLLHNIGKQDYMGTTVVGKEQYLFREPELIQDWSSYQKDIEKYAGLINQQALKMKKDHPQLKFIYINYPRKDIAMSKYLPNWYPSGLNNYQRAISILKKNLSEDVIFIDGYDVFKKHGILNQCYYRSDHHVNEKGQLAIYQELAKYIKREYPNTPVNTSQQYVWGEEQFVGSFDSQIGRILVNNKPKEKVIEAYKDKIDYVRYENGQKVETSLFENKKDYLRYMGGDKRETRIETDRDDLSNVLISGSSYTNSLEAISAGSVNRMLSVDYRYGQKDKSLEKYLKKYDIDYFVLVPNQSDKMFSIDALKIHLGL